MPFRFTHVLEAIAAGVRAEGRATPKLGNIHRLVKMAQCTRLRRACRYMYAYLHLTEEAPMRRFPGFPAARCQHRGKRFVLEVEYRVWQYEWRRGKERIRD